MNSARVMGFIQAAQGGGPHPPCYWPAKEAALAGSLHPETMHNSCYSEATKPWSLRQPFPVATVTSQQEAAEDPAKPIGAVPSFTNSRRCKEEGQPPGSAHPGFPAAASVEGAALAPGSPEMAPLQAQV